jgi:hypothetical protein
MSTQELAMEAREERQARGRVVELEVKLPKLEEIKLPKVNLEPARAIAEQVLLTGLGVGVLLVRGVVYAVKAANQAGAEAAKNPGPVVGTLLGLVRGKESAAATSGEIRMKVPVLPINNYDNLALADILGRLPQLSADQLRVVREYEQDHQARAEVLEAINRQLTQG